MAGADKKGKGPGKGVEGKGERKTMHAQITDSRFATQQTDPRFQRVPSKKKKVVVDSRFSAMLDDGGAFARKAVTDKYGRKVKHEIKEDLSRFYEMEEPEEGGEEAAEGRKGKKEIRGGDKEKKGAKKGAGDTSASRKARAKEVAGEDGGVDAISKELRGKDLRTAMMSWASSSSEDEGSADEDDYREEDRLLLDAVDVSKPLVPLSGHVEAGEETRRLALVNIDWERVRAIDLLMLLRSFAPSSGQVLSVKIYQSQFGKERMEHERHHGPGAFIGEGKRAQEEDEDEDEDGEVDMVKLRKYEAEKLKYFYAIAECDSERTAMAIYDQCDGVEYEASSNVLDLRYVPDEEEFDEEPHAEAHGEAPPDYVSPFFTNKALGHTKVELSWDRDDPERDVLKGKGIAGKSKKKKREAELEAIDYTPFVASSDEEEEAEDERQASKARALLLDGGGSSDPFGNKGGRKRGDEEVEGDMQITFTPGLTSIGESLLKRKEAREKEEEMTVWEKYQKKKGDRKAEARKGRKGKGEDEDEGELPEDSERVDDSFFADDPFFRLPDDDDEGEGGEGGGKGIFKKKKAAKSAAAEEDKRKREEARAEKEKKAAELENLKKIMGDGAGEKRGYEIKHAALGRATERAGEEARGKKGKKKRGREAEEAEGEDSFKLDVEDSRFSSIYTNPKFALDPTNPNFRKTPGLSKLLEAGNKKRKGGAAQAEAPAEQEKSKGEGGGGKKRDPQLASLVSSLKGRKWPKN